MWHLVFCFPISFVVINLVYVKEKKENWPILSKWKQKWILPMYTCAVFFLYFPFRVPSAEAHERFELMRMNGTLAFFSSSFFLRRKKSQGWNDRLAANLNVGVFNARIADGVFVLFLHALILSVFIALLTDVPPYWVGIFLYIFHRFSSLMDGVLMCQFIKHFSYLCVFFYFNCTRLTSCGLPTFQDWTGLVGWPAFSQVMMNLQLLRHFCNPYRYDLSYQQLCNGF